MFRFRDFMGDFREMSEMSGIFDCPKKFEILEYGRGIYHFKAPDVRLSNMSSGLRNI